MKQQGFLLGSVILVASVVITKILGLAFKIPLANMTGGTGMGYYSCAFAVFMPVYAVAVSGIPSAMARMTAENMAFGRYRNVRRLRRAAMVFFTGAGVVFSVLLIALAYPLCKYVVNEPNAFLSVVAVAPCVLLGAVMAVQRGYFEGMRNMIPTAVSEIVESVFRMLLGLGAAYAAVKIGMHTFSENGMVFGTTPENAEKARLAVIPFAVAASVFGVTIAHAASCLCLVIFSKAGGNGIPDALVEADPCAERMRTLLKKLILLMIPIAVASVISTISGIVDLVTINRCLKVALKLGGDVMARSFAGVLPDGAGQGMLPNFIYGSYAGLAMTVFGLVPSLTAMFGKSVLPGISESWAVHNTTRLKKNLNAVLFATTLTALPCGLGISVLSREILSLLFAGRPAEVAVSVRPLAVLGVGVVFLCIAAPMFAVLQAIGRPDLPVKITLAASLVKLAANLLLIPLPRLNITGAAIATTLTYALIAVWSLIEIRRLTKIKLDAAKIFIKPAIAAFLCTASAYLVNNGLENALNSQMRLLAALISSGIIYIISLIALGVVTKNEWKALFPR
ncbi:MAG: polysaccharide biosynthesis C-terminal domain-containing protein [Oscillospiraceae bacterium]